MIHTYINFVKEKIMDYVNIYLNLVNKNYTNQDFMEKHHIIPKSIFNDITKDIFNMNHILSVNVKNNIVKLPVRHHIVAHMLLVKIFKKINKNNHIRMSHALFLMINRSKYSKQTSWCRKNYIKMLSESRKGKTSPAKGKKWSQEAKEKRSLLFKNKTYEESYGIEKAAQMKKQRSDHMKIRVISEHTRKLVSLGNTKIWDKEKRAKMSKLHKGKKISQEHKDKMFEIMGNPDTNPFVDQNLYLFEHDDGRQIISRIYEMRHTHGCYRASQMTKGLNKKCKGWKFISLVSEHERRVSKRSLKRKTHNNNEYLLDLVQHPEDV